MNTIFWDLDNTLYEYQPCDIAGRKVVFAVLAAQLRCTRLQVEHAYTAARKQVHTRIPTHGSSHSRLLYIQTTIELLTGATDFALTQKTHELFWKAYYSKMKLRPGMRELLRDMHALGYQQAIVTDLTTDIQISKIRRLRIDTYIDLLISSEEAGAEKPAKAIMQLALSKAKCKPNEAVFIGDSLEKDRKLAKAFAIPFIEVSSNKHVSQVRTYLFPE